MNPIYMLLIRRDIKKIILWRQETEMTEEGVDGGDRECEEGSKK